MIYNLIYNIYIIYIYIQTTYIHQRRGENRPGEERERRGERREEWRGGERRDLLWVCWYLSFPRGRLWEKHGGRRALSCAKLGWNSTPASAVAAGSCYSQQQSQRLQELWAGHRASQSFSASLQRRCFTSGCTCAKTVLGSGRDQYCDFHHFWT